MAVIAKRLLYFWICFANNKVEPIKFVLLLLAAPPPPAHAALGE